MSRAKGFSIAFAVLGLLTILTPIFLLPVCEHFGKPVMNCSYSGKYETWLGAGIVVMAAGLAFLEKILEKIPGRRFLFPVLFLGAGVGIIAIPEVIGYCKSPQMPCNYGTIPGLRLIGGVVGITAVFLFLSLGKTRDEG